MPNLTTLRLRRALLVSLALTPATALGQGTAAPAPATGMPSPETGPAPSPAGDPAATPEAATVPPVETAPAPGAAQPPPAPPPAGPPPQIYVQQPMPPPPIPPRRRMYHDGFYLRLTVGGGVLAARSTISDVVGTEDASASIDGWGYMFDFALGGSPAPGLAVGGALLLQEAWEPDVEFDGPGGVSVNAPSTNDSLGFVLVGPMVDGFPDPDGGFHVGGTLGIAILGLEDAEGNASTGLGAAAWAGYLWWVSSEWSIGGTLRLSFARATRQLDLGDTTDVTRQIGIGFTALYH